MLDLHLHSSYSDGTLSPEALVSMARGRRLELVSITDHDTVDGTGEALAAGVRHGVRVLSGLELSVSWQSYHFHLLAYDFNWQEEHLRSGLKTLQEARAGRNRKIIEKLGSIGLPVNEEELGVIAGRGQTGRPHIARLLVAKKVVGSIDQAFAQFLG
ncbi:MAG: PHP domain-containing protein, partial [Desulfofustis sp.]|nr:PHP domain-containing protein [Desulfofustis sp.]